MRAWRFGLLPGLMVVASGCTPLNPLPSQASMAPLFGQGAAPNALASNAAPPQYPTAPASPAYPSYPNPSTLAPAPPPLPATTSGLWVLQGKPLCEPLLGGAHHYELSASNGRDRITLDVVVFDSRRFRLQVIDQPNPNAGSRVIADAMRAFRATAGVNGGFFNDRFAPLGMMISGGRPTGSFETGGILYGLVLELGGQPYIIWNAEYQGTQGVTDLLQSGPRLVNSRRPVDGLKRDNPRSRTFVATDGGFMWALGVTSSCDLGSLGDLLASPNILPDVPVMRALNLDGGRSSAIWMRTSTGREISRPGWSTVRNYLAIVPR